MKKGIAVALAFQMVQVYARSDYDLAQAIVTAEPEKVKLCLQRGVDPNIQFGPKNETALMLAIEHFGAKIKQKEEKEKPTLLPGMAQFSSGILLATAGALLAYSAFPPIPAQQTQNNQPKGLVGAQGASVPPSGTISQPDNSKPAEAPSATPASRSSTPPVPATEPSRMATFLSWLRRANQPPLSTAVSNPEARTASPSPDDVAIIEEQPGTSLAALPGGATEELQTPREPAPAVGNYGNLLIPENLGADIAQGARAMVKASRTIDRLATKTEKNMIDPFHIVINGGRQAGVFFQTLNYISILGFAILAAVGITRAFRGVSQMPIALLEARQRAQELEQLSQIIDLLLRQNSLNLSIKNAQQETALDVVHRLMIEHASNKGDYRLLEKIEQLIKTREIVV